MRNQNPSPFSRGAVALTGLIATALSSIPSCSAKLVTNQFDDVIRGIGSSYGDDVIRGIGSSYGDDILRGVGASYGDDVIRVGVSQSDDALATLYGDDLIRLGDDLLSLGTPNDDVFSGLGIPLKRYRTRKGIEIVKYTDDHVVIRHPTGEWVIGRSRDTIPKAHILIPIEASDKGTREIVKKAAEKAAQNAVKKALSKNLNQEALRVLAESAAQEATLKEIMQQTSHGIFIIVSATELEGLSSQSAEKALNNQDS